MYLNKLVFELLVYVCKFVTQSEKDVEKEQEAQLRAKYPGMKGPGTSALLQKRLAQKVSTMIVDSVFISAPCGCRGCK